MANHRRHRSYTAAAEAVASSFDLLHEIFLRLPPNSLLNFRSVCRQWYDLISSRQFRLHHTRRYGVPRTTGMFFGLRYRKYAEFDHKNYHLKSHRLSKFPAMLEILDSCNGLLLCSNARRDRKLPFEYKFYVCNPTTKQVSRIPITDPIRRKGFSDIHSKVLAFDPSMPENYRIVFVWFAGEYGDETWSYDVDMYESETGAWRHCTTFSTSECMHCRGVYWNGAVYWLEFSRVFLFSLDLKQQRFRETLLLPMIDEGNSTGIIRLGPCQGHLYLFGFDHLEHLRVYEMNRDDHPHLSMKVSIRINPLGTYYCTSADQVRIFMGGDDKLFVLLPLDEIVLIYDIKNPNSAPVTIFPGEIRDGFYVCYYSESLSPV